MTATLETTATPSAISNNALAEAFAELAGLITAWAHLPAVHHGTYTTISERPRIDLWFKSARHVAAWADSFDTQVTVDTVHETDRPFTITEADLPDRYVATLKAIHLGYLDEIAA